MKIEVYKGLNDQWYWRARARNGQIAAASGEPFHSKSNALRAARRIGVAISVARVTEVNPTITPGDYHGR